MKKIIRLLTLALLTVPVTTFAQSEGNQNTSEPAGKVVASKPDSLLDWETPHDPTCPQVLLETSMGYILVSLYNDTPKHRDNFLKLVNSGYYDGLQLVTRNRVINKTIVHASVIIILAFVCSVCEHSTYPYLRM